MGLFGNRFTKEGPGVQKNAPQKKGAARFFEIIFRDYGDLWKASIIFGLCCIPMAASLLPAIAYPDYLGVLLISIGLFVISSALMSPALVAMHAVVVFTVRDEPFFFWHEYKKAWKENWRQAILIGLLFSLLGSMEVLAIWLHLTMENSTSNVFLLAMVMLGMLLVSTCWLFSILQMLYLALPLSTILKNSLLLTFGYIKRSMPAGIITLILAGATILMFPITILLVLVGVPAVIALIADMWAWPVVDKAFNVSQQLEEKKERERAE